jgi:hypothetical protein
MLKILIITHRNHAHIYYYKHDLSISYFRGCRKASDDTKVHPKLMHSCLRCNIFIPYCYHDTIKPSLCIDCYNGQKMAGFALRKRRRTINNFESTWIVNIMQGAFIWFEINFDFQLCLLPNYANSGTRLNDKQI